MLLSEILDGLELDLENFSDFLVESIESDSRLIKKNSIFVALKGNTNNGVDFIESAIKNGARAIVIEKNHKLNLNYNEETTIIRCKDTRKTLIILLKRFYNNIFPEYLLGITGTQGKTSVVEFVRQILDKLGYNCASIGTLGMKYFNKTEKNNNLTMMEIVDLYKRLNFLKEKQNINFVALEITSQGLDTRRFDGLSVDIAGITNICNHEHLDYHKNMENYFNSKMELFKNHCKNNAKIILNPDTNYYDRIKKICLDKNYKIITFGYNKESDFRILSNKVIDGFQKFVFSFNNKEYKVKTRLFGDFQILNLLEALVFVFGLDLKIDFNKIVDTLQHVTAADGRMKFISKTKIGGYIYIDYAHTPSSYETVLSTIKEHLKKIGNGRLITLFGLGGDRDKSKRPIMGQIAQKYSDITIVTDDNPRTEKPEDIRKEVILGCNMNDKNLYNFDGGREKAIKFAISLIKKNDILILLGKGHENYQIIGNDKIYFSEEEVVLKNI